MLNFSMNRLQEDKRSAVQSQFGETANQPNRQEQSANEQEHLACDWWSDELEESFANAAQSAGLSPEQSNVLKNLFVETVCAAEAEDAEEQAANKQRTLQALERAWGQQANRKFAAANQAAAGLKLSSDMIEAIIVLPGSEGVLESLAKLGEMMAEDGALPNNTGRDGLDSSSAKQNLERLNADKDHVAAYLNRHHHGHDAAKRKRQQLIDLTLKS